ncbi:hypothetical protein FACS189481_4040 [Clostridia bacterium]|nr:hypothetical protein FACS189481_4040 [Clostridia bacterium]
MEHLLEYGSVAEMEMGCPRDCHGTCTKSCSGKCYGSGPKCKAWDDSMSSVMYID